MNNLKSHDGISSSNNKVHFLFGDKCFAATCEIFEVATASGLLAIVHFKDAWNFDKKNTTNR